MQNSINTILLTTDFTEKSQNALLMALNIASRHHSRLIVLHNIDNFFVIDKTGKQLLGADIVKGDVQRAENALRQMEISLKTKYPTLIIETILKNDSLIHGINEVIEDQDVDLVVCATSGKQNFVQVIVGSLSYEILTGSNTSVLLVPENCKKYKFEKILVPVRVLDDLSDKIDLSVTIAEKNKGVINLLGISDQEDVSKIKSAYLEVKRTLEESSQEYRSQFVMTDEKAIQISEHSKDDEADIIILNYRDENSWKSFFLENFFKKIISNTEIPYFF
ncbi:universal stress protein UspC [Chryseobacterium balustinum]|uniref:Universal stress protein UspC n=1 Tax=Chryseobacterium balustinum TaxID=246 RepID=A0AAX2IKW7_9FLAO|nr:universal stress protein [Chryseobacterium balustinum]SQA90096.1 universal stress protein UspC [Chryseobacterium balustinum]